MPIDPYKLNPIADRAKLSDPRRYDEVSAVKEPPKMFAGGLSDTPAFTASGVDPQLLLQLPAGVRHAVAAEPDITAVYRMFETYRDIPEIELDHEGLQDAKARVQDWLDHTDLDTRGPEQRQADADAEYSAMFPVDKDPTSYAAEQKRRAAAGEEPLEDFAVISQRRREREQWTTNNTQAGSR